MCGISVTARKYKSAILFTSFLPVLSQLIIVFNLKVNYNIQNMIFPYETCSRYLVFLIVSFYVAAVNCQKYVVSLEPVNWYQALINCKNAGMELASIHSEEEQNELNDYLKSNGYDKGYWLGATKEGNGQFYWAPTGIKMVYSNWLSGQPDDAKFDTNYYEGEHCVSWGMPTYSPDPIGWNDITCFNTLPYICQRFEYCLQSNDIIT